MDAQKDEFLAMLGHGGTVVAASEGPGCGAEFQVMVPLTAPPSSTSPPPKLKVEATRILLVEDGEDGAATMKLVLERYRHRVSVAGRGRDAIDMARISRPQLVLCDLGLPEGMSGYDVARAFRADVELKSIPLVALSGYAAQKDIRESKAAGFDQHLAKPADITVIDAAIRSLTDSSTE